MIFLNKKKILQDARLFLEKGLFRDGYLFLKKRQYYFFLLSRSSFFKTEYFFLIGAFLSNTGYYKNAIIYLKRSLISPHLDKSATFYYLAKSYSKINNHKKVRYYFNKLLDRSFSPFYIIFSYYECIKSNINFNIEIHSLKNLLPDTFDEIIDRLTMALFFMLDNRIKEAYELLKSYSNIFNRMYYYNIIFLKTLFKLKKYNKIIDYFNNNIEYLGNIDALFIYSAALYKIGLLDESLKILKEMLFLQKDLIKPVINIGKIYLHKKNYTQAIKLFKLALKKSKEYKDEVYFFLAVSHQRIGLLNNVLNYTKKIFPESKTYQKAMFNLALLYYDIQKFRDAKQIFLQIDGRWLPSFKYNKWKKRIIKINVNKKGINRLKYFIYWIPWIILAFSFIVLITFYMIIKHS